MVGGIRLLTRRVLTFSVLFAVWLLWSGHYTGMLLTFGVISCLLCVWLAERMERVAGAQRDYRLGLRWIPYGPWLLLEIVKSNVDVARAILSKDLKIQPQLVRLKATQKTDMARVIYANSITLTPGTITLDVRGDDFLVHALLDVTAEGVLTGEMDRRCTALEGSS